MYKFNVYEDLHFGKVKFLETISISAINRIDAKQIALVVAKMKYPHVKKISVMRL